MPAKHHAAAQNVHVLETDADVLTTNQGIPVADDDNSLRAGTRGPTLLEDFHFLEKIQHFDHERIPERAVHARGSAAHGFFEATEDVSDLTRAAFLRPGTRTPVFVRFSTVAGERGSSDMARDVRGFATKFYTEEGVFDIVGNNIPVFFIQDAIKFPDLVHAVKPEPHSGIPQAASAHDTFWDFVSLTPETTHMLMWVMSDRALPRSFSTMEGFGVHTFRLVNAEGTARLVKFHWKPKAGTHSLLWDEAVRISGADPDFHRRDLLSLIDSGQFPEWELGLQVFTEQDAAGWPFDVMDATKLVPEERVPVRIVGRMVLDRNPDNFFAETEQVAFSPGHLVPGIDVSEDPLLQGRIFSYQDTQLSRLGSANFHELPINRPRCPFGNNQRDGHMRVSVDRGRVAYTPSSLASGCPVASSSGFRSVPALVSGTKIRKRAESFSDHYSQARLFYLSQSPMERRHIVAAFQFELAKVESPEVRARMVANLARVDSFLASAVGSALDIVVPEAEAGGAESVDTPPSPLLSLLSRPGSTGIRGMRIALLVGDTVDIEQVAIARDMLGSDGASVKLLAQTLAPVQGNYGALKADHTLATMPSVLFDAVVLPGRANWPIGPAFPHEVEFVRQMYRDLKTVIFCTHAAGLVDAAQVDPEAAGVLPMPADPAEWAAAIHTLARRKHYAREEWGVAP